ncbi:hypothetical protein [Amycolatopsis viridis]|uniref:Uncharacterized protein n=1 Tax=Amycolatopsis viridis TaxID=185678 RepID=A0ABX0T0S3_9PSEU|nr:hypothetical protein [Amycolatopsis viridis]NIH81445.1 hypothetical protein [Amycolatopsis viridis]
MTSSTPGQENEPKPRTATVNLPFVKAEFRAPDLRLPKPRVPDRDEVTAALGAARSFLPPPRQLAYWGGLGVLAAVELIEWPVAVAIGVGTAVASRARGAEPRPPAAQPAGEPGQAQQGGESGPTSPAAQAAQTKPARARSGTQKRSGGADT